MALITFTSPMHKDKTVYAVAGSHKKTVLELAKENHVPIDFGCQNGECGTCLCKVTNITKGGGVVHAGPLTNSERKTLKELGKLSSDEESKMDVDDIPTPWRLACQMIVRDEDITIEYPST